MLLKSNTGCLTDVGCLPLCLPLCHIAADAVASHHPEDERDADLDLDLVDRMSGSAVV
jgi:hypothetical protein